MASRFGIADSDVIQDLKASSENRNTRKSTNLWVGVFKKWAKYRNMGEHLETYKVEELDEVLSRFYAEVRKTNGEEYEPDSLKVCKHL
jgi:L-lactate utilization protein LutB